MTDHYLPRESEIPNAATVAAMEEARQGELPAFNSVAELMAELNSED
jgi:DNA-damage-inducible protein J